MIFKYKEMYNENGNFKENIENCYNWIVIVIIDPQKDRVVYCPSYKSPYFPLMCIGWRNLLLIINYKQANQNLSNIHYKRLIS